MSNKLAPFACPLCADGTVRPARVAYPVAFRDKTYTVPDAEVMRCDACGEIFFAPGQSDALQRRAADMARREMGMVTGEEIAAFRKAHGLTQSELEDILGVPRKTVARWEIGSVLQSRMADTFLKLLIDCPELLYRLPKMRGRATRYCVRRAVSWLLASPESWPLGQGDRYVAGGKRLYQFAAEGWTALVVDELPGRAVSGAWQAREKSKNESSKIAVAA